MHVMNDHEHYMRRAIELAANVPDFPFGALIVHRDSGKILAEGWNKSSINPTLHGEIDAINQLVLYSPRISSDQLALYTTAEPCPMCQGARSFGQEFKWLSLVHPFAHFKKWDGDRSTFLQKKWFVAALGGNARSQAAFWNMTVTLCLRWQFLEGMIENEISLLGWLFGLLDGRIADG